MKKMKDRSDFLAAIYLSMEDAVIGETLDGRIASWNPAAEKLFGYSEGEAIGNPVSLIGISEHADEFSRIRDKLAAGSGIETYESQRKTKDGRIIDVRVAVSPMRSGTGRLTGVATIEQDITGQKQALRSLEASKIEQEAFYYSISHDLRAPLRCIDGFSLALLEDYEDKLDSAAMQYLQEIRSSSQLMGRLIEGILQLSKLSRTEVHIDKVDLSKVANDVVCELKRNQPACKAVFVIADRVETYSDENLLKIVLQNLLGDAVQFTTKLNQPRIEFGVEDSNSEHAYYVRDNGVGFDMEYDSKHGMGLAFIQRIISRLGGRVWAEDDSGQGATFYFTLRS